jgi:uncharacterized caspase-like protein
MRHVIRSFALLCCAVVGLQALPAEARRVALVIGNAQYQHGALLRNPINDATAVAEAFEKLKFDKVALRKDLDRRAFVEALAEMARETADADIGVVYFAGHGNPTGSRNFLFPVDAEPADLEHTAIDLDQVLASVSKVKQLVLFIIDTHHSTLILPELRPAAEPSTTRGLHKIRHPSADVLVVYSGKPGQVVSDGTRRHSPFTESLVKHLLAPALEVRVLFGRVRDDVIEATNEAQHPWAYGTLGGQEFYLNPPAR